MGKPARRLSFVLVLLPVLGPALVACGGPKLGPRSVNHTSPEVTVDFDVFENASCPPGKYGLRDCEADSPLVALGCG